MSTFTQSPDAVSIPNTKTWGSMKTQSSQVGIPMFASQRGQSRLDRPGASASLRAVHHAQRWTDFFMKCDKHIKSTRDGEQLPGLKPWSNYQHLSFLCVLSFLHQLLHHCCGKNCNNRKYMEIDWNIGKYRETMICSNWWMLNGYSKRMRSQHFGIKTWALPGTLQFFPGTSRDCQYCCLWLSTCLPTNIPLSHFHNLTLFNETLQTTWGYPKDHSWITTFQPTLPLKVT